MSDRLVTVATFWSPVEANLARNRLEAAGMRAFLASEESVRMAWHLTNAFGGVKLEVGDGETEEALAILTEDNTSGPPRSGQPEEALSPPSEVEQPGDPSAGEAAEAEPVLTSREQNADRAFRGAVFGLLLLPLQLYVFWLLLKVFVSDERLGPEERRHAVVAAVINLPILLSFGQNLCLLLGAILAA
jgi:hypothetical protein